MPYKKGNNLPGERASRIGHLDVIKNEFVRKLIESFKEQGISKDIEPNCSWNPIISDAKPLRFIFGIDGSFQIIETETFPYKRIAFVKTALIRLDQYLISKIDRRNPHPFAIRDLLSESAIQDSTVFPLRYVSIPGLSTYNTIREIIYESLRNNSQGNEPLETLKWLVFRKWQEKEEQLKEFECPNCGELTTLPFDVEVGECIRCKGRLFLSDMLGFHLDMAEHSASDSIATNYMAIHEVLMLFTGIRYFWEHDKKVLNECLFVKDGPLMIRAQYSKLVQPIREFIEFAKKNGVYVKILGQEKSGCFSDHLTLICRDAPEYSIFIPDGKYISEQIQNRNPRGAPYGKDTNYGAKIFVILDKNTRMVLNIPTGLYIENPVFSELIGADRIFATLPSILSYKYEGAILPIELAHSIASLSTYPSAKILKIFSETKSD